jgi:hypothetical protein
VAECGRRAKNEVRAADFAYALLLPLSADVEDCQRVGGIPTYRASVDARGPYGIPIARYEVGPQGIRSQDLGGNLVMAAVVLLAGAALVSAPFAFIWLRSRLGRRLEFAA